MLLEAKILDAIVGFIGDLGLNAFKDFIVGRYEEEKLKKEIEECAKSYFESHVFQLPLESEINWGGLVEELNNSLIDKIKIYLIDIHFSERDRLLTSILRQVQNAAKAYNREQIKTVNQFMEAIFIILSNYFIKNIDSKYRFLSNMTVENVQKVLQMTEQNICAELSGIVNDASATRETVDSIKEDVCKMLNILERPGTDTMQLLGNECYQFGNQIGRKDELETLADEILSSKMNKLILLYGENGSGKTTLCEHFLIDCRCKFYNIKCETISTYEGFLSVMAKTLYCSDDAKVPEKIVLHKIDEIDKQRQETSPIILYLDNLDSLLSNEECFEFKNFVSQVCMKHNIRLLATTAICAVKNIKEYAKLILLSDLSDEYAPQLFAKLWNEYHGQKNKVLTEEVADFVNNKLKNHALTIEICCSYSVGYSFAGFLKHWDEDAGRMLVDDQDTPFRRSFNKQWQFLYQHKYKEEFFVIWHIFYYMPDSILEDELYKIIATDRTRWERAVNELVKIRIIDRNDEKLYMKPVLKYQLSYPEYRKDVLDQSIIASEKLQNYYLDIQQNMDNKWALFVSKLADITYYLSVISTYDSPELAIHIKNLYYPCRCHFHHVTIRAIVFLEKLYQNLVYKTNLADLLSDIRFRIGQLKFYLCDNQGALDDYQYSAKLRNTFDEKDQAIYDLYKAEILMFEVATLTEAKKLLISAYNILQGHDCIDTARAKRLYVSKIMIPEMRDQYNSGWPERTPKQYLEDGVKELEEAASICVTEKNYFELCYVLRNWGEWYVLCMEFFPRDEQTFITKAIEKYLESQECASTHSFKYALAHVAKANGDMYRKQRQLDSAMEEYRYANSIYEELCEYQGNGHATKAEADIYAELYEESKDNSYYQTAYRKYTDAICLYKKAACDRGRAFAYLGRSMLLGKSHKSDAVKDAHEAIHIFRAGQLGNDEKKVKDWLDKLEVKL